MSSLVPSETLQESCTSPARPLALALNQCLIQISQQVQTPKRSHDVLAYWASQIHRILSLLGLHHLSM